MPKTIVIADDVTGANDIGIMYAKSGLDTLVYSYGDGAKQAYQACDVLVVDTDSRFDTYENAYQKVYDALKKIPQEGAAQYIDKQCSVFRGNIGAEFDAMLDALGEEFAVVVLGFPNNGRTTLHGIHYVHGVKLEESQFQNDPVHPMHQSALADILGSQTKRSVGNVYYETYAGGVQAVKAAVNAAREKYNYCILDVRDNGDLELLAEALMEEKIICGSSALSEYLAKRMVQENGGAAPEEKKRVSAKVFCMAGSLTPQTAAQTSYMREAGYPVFELDTRKLFEKTARQAECDRIYELVDKAYAHTDFAMIHSANNAETVAETKRIAAEIGIDNTEVSSMVSGVLSEISEKVIDAFSIRRIIVCGGDTSAALCAKLHIKGMKVLEEIEAGLPTCESVDEPHYRLVLKSGSFGTKEFVEKAIEKLRLE